MVEATYWRTAEYMQEQHKGIFEWKGELEEGPEEGPEGVEEDEEETLVVVEVGVVVVVVVVDAGRIGLLKLPFGCLRGTEWRKVLVQIG